MSRLILIIFFVSVAMAGKSQKVLDSIAHEACDCMEDFLSRTKIPVEDSLNYCITGSMDVHLTALKKVKKLKAGTTEGYQETYEKVRKRLQKKCRVFTGQE